MLNAYVGSGLATPSTCLLLFSRYLNAQYLLTSQPEISLSMERLFPRTDLQILSHGAPGIPLEYSDRDIFQRSIYVDSDMALPLELAYEGQAVFIPVAPVFAQCCPFSGGVETA